MIDAGASDTRRNSGVSGKPIAVVMLLLGVALAIYAGWFYYRLQRRPIQLWGAEVAQAIKRAPSAAVLKLEPKPSARTGDVEDDVIAIEGQNYRVVARRDVSDAPGFSHVRASLLNDAAFDWTADTAPPSTWRYAMRFADGEQRATLLFDAPCRRVAVVENDARAAVDPIATAVRTYVEQLFNE